MTLKEHYKKLGFNDQQIAVIQKGVDNQIPLEHLYLYDDVSLSASQMEEIYKGIEVGLTTEQLEVYALSEFSESQMEQIRYGFQDDLSMEQIQVYADTKYSDKQMNAMREGLRYGLDLDQIQLYANPSFDSQQMYAILKGFESGLDMEQVQVYAFPELPDTHMDEVMQGLSGGLNLAEASFLANPDLHISELSSYRKTLMNHSASLNDVTYLSLQDTNVDNKMLVLNTLKHGVSLDDIKNGLSYDWCSLDNHTLQQQLRDVERECMPQYEQFQKKLEESVIGDSFSIYQYSYSQDENQIIETPYTAVVVADVVYEPFLQIPSFNYYDMDGNRAFPFIDNIPRGPVADLNHSVYYFEPNIEQASTHFQECIQCCLDNIDNQIADMQAQKLSLEAALDGLNIDESLGGIE